MITIELMNSDEWKTSVSDQLEILVDASNEDKDLNQMYKEVIQHAFADENEANLAYIGKLLIARNNIRNYGGGISGQLMCDPLAKLVLFCNELPEINIQLDALAMLEFTYLGLTEPGVMDEGTRLIWSTAADKTDEQVDNQYLEDGIFRTPTEIANRYLDNLKVASEFYFSEEGRKLR